MAAVVRESRNGRSDVEEGVTGYAFLSAAQDCAFNDERANKQLEPSVVIVGAGAAGVPTRLNCRR